MLVDCLYGQYMRRDELYKSTVFRSVMVFICKLLKMWYSLECDLWICFAFHVASVHWSPREAQKSVVFERQLYLLCNLRQKERAREETIKQVTRSRSGAFGVHKEQSRLVLGQWRENQKGKGLSSSKDSDTISFNAYSHFVKGQEWQIKFGHVCCKQSKRE